MTPFSWSPEVCIQCCLALPLLGAILVAVLGRWPNLRDGVSIVVASMLFLVAIALSRSVFAGQRPLVEVWELVPGFDIGFRVEPLGMVFALVASGLWILTTCYAIGYMRGHHERHQTRFFACFALAIFAAFGAAMAENLLTLFVFYEVMTLSTYPLVTHHGTAAAKRGGRVYIGILMSTSVAFLMLAIAWTSHVAGTLSFAVGGILAKPYEAGLLNDRSLAILLALFAFGTGKAALMPFHRWLPAAMVAPTPVSALLHAVAVVKVGVFTILKTVVYVFGIDLLATTGVSTWLMYVAAVTILLGSIIALTKDNLKARLAYSTISQLSYIVLGAAIARPDSIVGSGMHIIMHAVGKITLFFCAGAIYVAAHKTEISDMRGIGRTMPFTMLAFSLATVSIIGLPPFGGSWSKWFLALGAAESGHFLLIAVLMISTLLNIAYLVPIIVRGFLDGSHVNDTKIKEAPLMCVVPLCLTALGTLLLFFCVEPIHDVLRPITNH